MASIKYLTSIAYSYIVTSYHTYVPAGLYICGERKANDEKLLVKEKEKKRKFPRNAYSMLR